MSETPNPNYVDSDTLTGEMRPIRRCVLPPSGFAMTPIPSWPTRRAGRWLACEFGQAQLQLGGPSDQRRARTGILGSTDRYR